MADSTISGLAAGVQPADADYFVTVQNGVTVRVTALQLANYAAVAPFGASGSRYPGDFSNATLVNRTLFKSITLNGITDVGAIPNGAATESRWTAYDAVDPTNAHFIQLRATSTGLILASGANGTGTAQPFRMLVSGLETYRINPATGAMLFGSSVDDLLHNFQFTGSLSLTGAYAQTGNSVILGNQSVSGDNAGVTFNGGPLSGDRDRLINGRFRIDQENAGAAKTIVAAAALAYVIDRWWAYCTGGNITGQQTIVGTNYTYRFTGGAGNLTFGWAQRIESLNILDQAGSTVTLRVKLTASGARTIAWAASFANTTNAFGSLAAPTKTAISSGTFNVTTTETDFYAQIPLPAGATNGVEILFTGGPLTAGQTLTVRDVGLLTGNVNESILPFRHIQTDMLLCRGHYRKSFAVNTAAAQNLGINTGEFTWPAFQAGALNARPTSVLFEPPMRGAPTMTFYNPQAANGNVRDSTNSVDASAPTVAYALDSGFAINASGNAASTVAARLGVHWAARYEL